MAVSKNVHTNVVQEIAKKRDSINEFTAYAAAHQSEDNFRSQVNHGLVNEIKMKRPSINKLTAGSAKKLIS